MTVASRSLEKILGVSPSALTWQTLLELVAGNAKESDYLEFKQSHYGNSDSERREAAKDVAALANAAGGVLLIGIKEDALGSASGIASVPIDEGAITRHRLLVTANIAPIAEFAVHTIANPDDPSTGVVVVEVSSSALAPHAVKVNDDLRYPQRNGRTTRLLREHEVADAYRERFAASESRQELLEMREREVLATLDPSQTWLVLTSVPDFSESIRLDRALMKEIRDAHIGQGVSVPAHSLRWESCRSTYRCLRFDAGLNAGPTKRAYGAADLYTDGSGVFAMQMWPIQDYFADRRSGPAPTVVDDESVAAGTIGGIRWLGLHANRFRAQGMLNLRVRIWPISEDSPVLLGQRRGIMQGSWRESSSSTTPAELSVPLQDLEVDGIELMRAAAATLHEVGQTLGVVEMPQISSEGEVRARYWQQDSLRPLSQWCDQHQIPVINEVLSD